MKVLSILAFFCFVACQDLNSNSSDAVKFKKEPIDPAFAQAYSVIQSRCVNCHENNYHASWAKYRTSASWVATGLVVPGDANSSQFIRRIINSGLEGANSNMPRNNGALPNDEYQYLVDWINSL